MEQQPPAQGAEARGATTRAQLARACLDLLGEGAAGSPGEIADRAGVNRSSFYAHFRSMGELAIHALREQLEPSHDENLARHDEHAVAPVESNRLVIRRIVDMAAEQPGGALGVLLTGDRVFGEWAFGRILNGYVQDYFDAIPAFAAVPERRRAVAGEYLGHALSAVICSWLAGELPASRDEVVELLAGLVPAWVMDAGEVRAG